MDSESYMFICYLHGYMYITCFLHYVLASPIYEQTCNFLYFGERVSKLLDVFSIGAVRLCPSNQAFCFKGPKLRIDWPEKVAELLFYIWHKQLKASMMKKIQKIRCCRCIIFVQLVFKGIFDCFALEYSYISNGLKHILHHRWPP